MTITDIEIDVISTHCAPMSQQLTRFTFYELRCFARTLNVNGPTLSKAELAQAVAARLSR